MWHLWENMYNKGQNSAQAVRSEGKSTRNDPADTKVREEGGGRDAPGAGAENPLQTVGRTMVEQISTLQPLEDTTPERMDIPGKKKILPVETPQWIKFILKDCSQSKCEGKE